MRKTLTTSALLLVLSCTALGGEIHIPPVAPDPPQANTAQEPITTDEDITGAPDTLVQAALAVLMSVLS